MIRGKKQHAAPPELGPCFGRPGYKRFRFLTELQYRKAVFRTLAGIGFTISLFIAMLAFQDAALVDAANVGILAGSLLAGILATLMVKTSGRRSRSLGSAPSV